MIADDIIDAVAKDKRIKAAVTELVDDLLADKENIGCNTANVSHDFECKVHGQTFDVKISMIVATKKKH